MKKRLIAVSLFFLLVGCNRKQEFYFDKPIAAILKIYSVGDKVKYSVTDTMDANYGIGLINCRSKEIKIIKDKMLWIEYIKWSKEHDKIAYIYRSNYKEYIGIIDTAGKELMNYEFTDSIIAVSCIDWMKEEGVYLIGCLFLKNNRMEYGNHTIAILNTTSNTIKEVPISIELDSFIHYLDFDLNYDDSTIACIKVDKVAISINGKAILQPNHLELIDIGKMTEQELFPTDYSAKHSPSWSHAINQLVYIEVDTIFNCYLNIYSHASRKIKNYIYNGNVLTSNSRDPNKYVLFSPVWSENDKFIAMLIKDKGNENEIILGIADINTKKVEIFTKDAFMQKNDKYWFVNHPNKNIDW